MAARYTGQPAPPQYPQMYQSQQAPPPPPPPQVTPPASNDAQTYISTKIYKINGKDKVLDFSSKLVPAFLADFANIHGCGGKNHANNSTIAATLCDFTKGTGEASVTVSYNIDVEDMAILKEAAMAARLGLLCGSAAPPAPVNNTEADALRKSIEESRNYLRNWAKLPTFPDDTIPVPKAELVAAGQWLSYGLNAAASTPATGSTPASKGGEAAFSYSREKVNPYKIENGMAPAQKVTINYVPYRPDGQRSRYPWYVSIENCTAPIIQRDNGANSYDSRKATNRKTAFIILSEDDFAASMVAVERFISLWEMMYLGQMKQAYKQIEANRQAQAG